MVQLHAHYGLSTLATIVAEFGDKLSPKSATIVSSVDRALEVIFIMRYALYKSTFYLLTYLLTFHMLQQVPLNSSDFIRLFSTDQGR